MAGRVEGAMVAVGWGCSSEEEERKRIQRFVSV